MSTLTEERFLEIVRDELDLPLLETELENDFDQVVSWDSLYLLRLVAAVEQETGTRVPVGRLFSKRSLRDIYTAIAGATAAV
ncbi:MAG TPA: acyl carrier protein [Actinocrinis sp.]|nr:acyl carrier protein [Actinocrinis sp.]HEU5427213.1 acyl carrier protein [Actinocrinis sp.]